MAIVRQTPQLSPPPAFTSLNDDDDDNHNYDDDNDDDAKRSLHWRLNVKQWLCWLWKILTFHIIWWLPPQTAKHLVRIKLGPQWKRKKFNWLKPFECWIFSQLEMKYIQWFHEMLKVWYFDSYNWEWNIVVKPTDIGCPGMTLKIAAKRNPIHWWPTLTVACLCFWPKRAILCSVLLWLNLCRADSISRIV